MRLVLCRADKLCCAVLCSSGGGRVDGAVFTARLQGMLVRPSKLWDTDSAMAWCAELRDGSAPDRGSASLGAQPDMA